MSLFRRRFGHDFFGDRFFEGAAFGGEEFFVFAVVDRFFFGREFAFARFARCFFAGRGFFACGADCLG